MKRYIPCAVVAAAQAMAGWVSAQSPPEFRAADFGATPGDETDDRPAIQTALDAAAAAGGGVVRLDAGTFDIVVVLHRGLGPVTGYAQGIYGYHGLVVPPGCTLSGAGQTETLLRISAPANAVASYVGHGIINGGYDTALEDFGAGGGIVISDLGVIAADVALQPIGNLIAMAHANGVTVSRVSLGSSKHHALEVIVSRNVIIEDCDFDGTHPTSTTLQYDFGSVGAKSSRPRGTTVSDVLVRRCRFHGRSTDVNAARVIDLGHTNASCILRNLAFEDCEFESLTSHASAVMAFDNPPSQELSGLRVERCHFRGIQEKPSTNGMLNLPHGGMQTMRDVLVRDCLFSGAFSQGVVLNSTVTSNLPGHSGRRNLVLEGNRFAPVLDRSQPFSGNGFRMIAAVSCGDLTIRRNLFEVPATATNLTLGAFINIQAANCLDTRIEENVFTWAHQSAATVPFGATYTQYGIIAPSSLLEQAAMKATVRLTGNVFLYPPNGVGSVIRMLADVPTTSWAPGGPWVGGLIAGNYASGATTAGPWQIHHDLSGVANVGELKPVDPSRTAATGWYPCNGAALTTLDSGNNRLARVNAEKCGYSGNLPVRAGEAVRLHGPLSGAGLLAASLTRYAGHTYRGIHQDDVDLSTVTYDTILHGDIRVIRQPLTVYCWDAAAPEDDAGSGTILPAGKPPGAPGRWLPFHYGQEQLAETADTDGHGLTNIEERALLRDPLTVEPPQVAVFTTAPSGEVALQFACAAGPHAPRIRLLTSSDLTQWSVESSSTPGGLFETPSGGGTLFETPYRTGRTVILTAPRMDRRFWRVAVDP